MLEIMLLHTLTLSAAASLSMLQAASAPPAPQPAVFQDKTLHYTLEYPAELIANDGLAQAAMPAAKAGAEKDALAKQAMSCLTVPLVAVENLGSLNFGFLILTRLDLTCMKQSDTAMSLNELTLSALTTALTMVGKPSMGSASDYKIAGLAASTAQGKIEAADSMIKAPIFGVATCSIVEHQVLCVSAMSGDQSRVHQIVSGNIKFDGKTAEPLVPPSLLK